MNRLIIFILILQLNQLIADVTPVVMWHGMGDSCCLPFSLGRIANILHDKLPPVYVKSLKIGQNSIQDYESGFFGHPNHQVADACKQIANDPLLRNGYNAIGFSQGSQFLRAVAERCPTPPMKQLISFGGQHQGVFGLPNCPSLSHRSCDIVRKMLNLAAYTKAMQDNLVQATYWHDPLHEQSYINGSTFLADINNERTLNQTYKDNLLKLKNIVLVKFTEDTIVQPKETQWFEFYEPGQDKNILPLNQSKLYLEDRIGLKELDETNRLKFIECKGNHLQFTDKWFDEQILPILRL